MTPIDISRFEQLKASGELPSPKGVAMAIIHLCHQNDVTLSDLSRLVMTDPAFVGRLVRAANGNHALGHRPLVSVKDALVSLGLPTVRGLALEFSLVSSHPRNLCAEFDYQAFWSASLACGIAMQSVCGQVLATTPDEGFTLGLLARVGELAMATLFPEEYGRVLRAAREPGAEGLKALEQAEFVMDHCELGSAILADWGLPKVFFEPVLYQENVAAAAYPEASRHWLVAHSLALSRCLSDLCLTSGNEREAGMPKLLELGRAIGLGVDELLEVFDQVDKAWNEWSHLLQLRTEFLPPLEEMVPDAAGTIAAGESRDVFQDEVLRVLVVDDDPVMRALVRKVVEKAGHEVHQATNGKEGLEKALECQPHMMIVDWLMPELDGMALTKALRQTKIGRAIYVLILTSLEDDEFLIEAFENGVDDYLAKPLKQKVLAARLRAGQRVVKLHREIQRDQENLRRAAAELAISNRRLQEAALTDPLTGLPNRRYAMERLNQEWAGSERAGRALACLLIDLDGFKPVNDTYGHDMGDALLTQAATVLKRGLREPDVLCRLGGDEFLAICPGTTLEQALVCAERVRGAMEESSFCHEGTSLRMTVSIGAAVRNLATTDIDALIKRADESLYLAKERGRNTVATC